MAASASFCRSSSIRLSFRVLSLFSCASKSRHFCECWSLASVSCCNLQHVLMGGNVHIVHQCYANSAFSSAQESQGMPMNVLLTGVCLMLQPTPYHKVCFKRGGNCISLSANNGCNVSFVRVHCLPCGDMCLALCACVCVCVCAVAYVCGVLVLQKHGCKARPCPITTDGLTRLASP